MQKLSRKSALKKSDLFCIYFYTFYSIDFTQASNNLHDHCFHGHTFLHLWPNKPQPIHLAEPCLQTQAKPRAAQELQTPSTLIHSLTDPLVKISLRRRHALMVEDGALRLKKYYV